MRPRCSSTTSATTAATTPTESSSSATCNYELDRTISHVSDPAGRLVRLTVAVVVDNKLVSGAASGAAADTGSAKAATSVPFTPKELQHLTELTKNVVGFNAARGDSISVINQPFLHSPAPEAMPRQPLWQRPGVMDLLKQGAGILAALLVAFGLLRPLLKGLLRNDTRALPAPTPKISVRVADEPEVADARLPPAAELAYDQRIDEARRMVGENSKQVAQVVKNWVSTDGS